MGELEISARLSLKFFFVFLPTESHRDENIVLLVTNSHMYADNILSKLLNTVLNKVICLVFVNQRYELLYYMQLNLVSVIRLLLGPCILRRFFQFSLY